MFPNEIIPLSSRNISSAGVSTSSVLTIVFCVHVMVYYIGVLHFVFRCRLFHTQLPCAVALAGDTENILVYLFQLLGTGIVVVDGGGEGVAEFGVVGVVCGEVPPQLFDAFAYFFRTLFYLKRAQPLQHRLQVCQKTGW